MNQIVTLHEEVKRVQEYAKRTSDKAYDSLLLHLAESGLVSIITVRRYTPDFNDGDACYPRESLFVNVQQHADESVDLPEDLEDAELKPYVYYNYTTREYIEIPEALQHNIEQCSQRNHVYLPPEPAVMDAIADIIQHVTNQQYGDNFSVTYTFKDKQIQVVHDEYYES